MVRVPAEDQGSTQIGGLLWLDHDRKVLHIGERIVNVTPLELRVLDILLQNSGRVVTFSQLISYAWGSPADDTSRYTIQLKSLIQRLRRKTETESGKPRRILCVRGFGYLLENTVDCEKSAGLSGSDDGLMLV